MTFFFPSSLLSSPNLEKKKFLPTSACSGLLFGVLYAGAPGSCTHLRELQPGTRSSNSLNLSSQSGFSFNNQAGVNDSFIAHLKFVFPLLETNALGGMDNASRPRIAPISQCSSVLTVPAEELDVPGHRTAGANPPSLHASSENLLCKIRYCYFTLSSLLGPFLLSSFQRSPSTMPTQTKKGGFCCRCARARHLWSCLSSPEERRVRKGIAPATCVCLFTV